MQLLRGYKDEWFHIDNGSSDLHQVNLPPAETLIIGQAVCSRLMTLETRAEQLLPELNGTDLGISRVRDLLTISSGTWFGNIDSSVETDRQAADLHSGSAGTIRINA